MQSEPSIIFFFKTKLFREFMFQLVSQLHAISKRLHFTSIRYNYEVPFRDKKYFNI